MAGVTFPTEYGGDGNTYTDDADPNTGLANDGHRARFVPALSNAVAMAAWAEQKAAEAHGDRLITTKASAQAVGAKGDAVKAASTATVAAAQAQAAAQDAAGTYGTAAGGLSSTTDGQFFIVPENGYLQMYRNSNGAAEPIMKLASQEALVALNNRPDPLLTSLIF